MLVPVNWLKEYIKIDEDSRIIADKVTDSGSHVEAITSLNNSLSGFKVGKILELRPHETLKKLQIVDLDLKDEVLTLVTGAKNMKVGDKVVVATLGAVLPGGIVIKEADFGGVISPGMLCSYQELGQPDNVVPKASKEGVIILPQEAETGADALEVLGLNTDVIEFEITPNRPDCLSIIGMAREVAAVFDKKIELPCDEVVEKESDISQYFGGIKLQTEKVNRFMLGVIKDVEVKESPLFIQNHLRAAGMRPINNIVDITNFIMLEYGQPMHAYDLDKIQGNSLIVRMAKEGERLKTLDEIERKLETSDILICDGQDNPIGLAGIMGGMDTEVTHETKNILIESANFDADTVKQSSKRMQLRSEASSRFEKTIPAQLSEFALNRFFHLIEKTNSGKIVNNVYDEGFTKPKEKEIKLRNTRAKELLGLDLEVENSKKFLESLELKVKVDGDNLFVTIPYFRSDLEIEVDLIEEIGRLYGFHNIAAKPLTGSLTKGVKSSKRNYIDSLRTQIYALGFSEILTYSFISEKQYEKMLIPKEDKLRNVIRILNPLGEDFSVMRTTLIGNMLETVRKNLNNKQMELRLSEVGNSFRKDENENIYENTLMTISLVGDYDFYYIKDVLLKIFEQSGVKETKFVKNANNSIFHSGRCADVFAGEILLGSIGEINPVVLENFDISKRVYLFEINVDKMMENSNKERKYKKISRYPLVERDIALVVDKETESENIIEIIKSNGGDILKTVTLFDIYTGAQIEENKKSLAYKIGFQSDDRTLKDQEVKEAFERILDALNKAYNVNLRG
ncbi:MAG: phenylalanine--tRNA ligase subunit beta [Tissierellia bacterium]|nr:phenylalanine--tRNA ligase subunit beta [Tissierellia bacterium]